MRCFQLKPVQLCAERHVKGCAVLGSGYDFELENKYLHLPGNFMGPRYDSAMLMYWKGYLKQHQEQLSAEGSAVDVQAGLHAHSVKVLSAAPSAADLTARPEPGSSLSGTAALLLRCELYGPTPVPVQQQRLALRHALACRSTCL